VGVGVGAQLVQGVREPVAGVGRAAAEQPGV
jgi:hypothetical protein